MYITYSKATAKATQRQGTATRAALVFAGITGVAPTACAVQRLPSGGTLYRMGAGPLTNGHFVWGNVLKGKLGGYHVTRTHHTYTNYPNP
jgi:hypothetical protein